MTIKARIMTEPTCVITGCELVLPNDYIYHHGDLHELGDVWIFNSVLDNDYEAKVFAIDRLHPSLLQLILSANAMFFERRGVFVIHKTAAEFNAVAKEYVERWTHND